MNKSILAKINKFIFNLYEIELSTINDDSIDYDATKKLTNYIIHEINATQDNDLIDAVKVMALEYYNFYYDEPEDDIINMMKEVATSDDFVELVIQDEELVSSLIENELTLYSVGGYNYDMVDAVLKTKEGQEMYQIFHPLYDIELECYNEWKKARNVEVQMIEVPVANFFEYYYLAMNLAEISDFTDENVQILSDKIEQIGIINPSLEDEINTKLIKFFYEENKNKTNNKLYKYFIDQLEDMTRIDIITTMANEEETRKMVVKHFLENYKYGINHDKETEKNKSFYKKLEQKK